jgi:D-alanine--poly(phosphoribitol) ligase subunit 1
MRYQINALEFFLRSLRASAGAICVNDRGVKYTYAEVFARARGIADAIVRAGNPPLTPVVIALPKSMDAVASILGTLLSGNVYVPVDVKSPDARLSAVRSQLGPHVVVSSHAVADSRPSLSDAAVMLEELPLSLGNSETAFTLGLVPSQVIDADPAYVIFTSGSTGVPKGVTISHRSIIDYIEWAQQEYSLAAADVMMSQAPLFFDNSTLDLYLTWAAGGCLFIPDDQVYMFPVQVLEAMLDHGVTTVFWVPSVLVNLANSGLLDRHRVPSLRRILFAGEPMPVPQINAWVRAYPECLFSNLYGPTEITVDCTAFTFREEYPGTVLPIGYACRNTDVLILDDAGQSCAAGQVGELCVRGSSLALGYWNDEAMTSRVFMQNPLNARYRDLIYRTGDLAHRDEAGCITFIGRRDTQVKHMGYRIELGEIEAALVQHPQVAAACVVHFADQNRLAAAVVAKEAGSPSDADVRRFLLERVPRYMVPHVVIPVQALPMNANGKVDRTEVSRRIRSGVE